MIDLPPITVQGRDFDIAWVRVMAGNCYAQILVADLLAVLVFVVWEYVR